MVYVTVVVSLAVRCRCDDVEVVFFVSSRRRHTSCALVTGVQTCALPIFLVDRLINRLGADRVYRLAPVESDLPERAVRRIAPLAPPVGATWPDRKSLVSGKSVSVRVDLGGRRFIQKKNLLNAIHFITTQHYNTATIYLQK